MQSEVKSLKASIASKEQELKSAKRKRGPFKVRNPSSSERYRRHTMAQNTLINAAKCIGRLFGGAPDVMGWEDEIAEGNSCAHKR